MSQQTGRAESALAVPVTQGDGSSSSCLSPGLPGAHQPEPGNREGLKAAATAAAPAEPLLSPIYTRPSAQQQRVLQLMVTGRSKDCPGGRYSAGWAEGEDDLQ